MSDEDIKAKSEVWRDRIKNGTSLDDLIPDVFAAVREVSNRLLHMRHFDVQLVGGVVLHQGRIAEMKTGEGKTLVAVAPLVLNALSGSGAHLVTANDYLARRDAVWMGPIYHFFGLSLGIIQGQGEDSDELGGSFLYTPGVQAEDPRYSNLTPCSRRDAYLCDVVYGTNHEYGFDYLRDNMAFDETQLVMAELNYAIVDEVDSILIDEARTPHIISGPSAEDISMYKVSDQVVRQLQPEIHFTSDKKNHSVAMTEEGMDLVEQILNLENIAEDPRLLHHVNASLKAHALFDRDVDYVVRNGEVVIVDENTGRMMFGRRYSDGLHQALEAKENVPVQRESQTVAVITFQNLFRLYGKLAGMTGTAKTEEDEFRKIYGLDVVSIPTHRPMKRVDQEDVIYKTMEGKLRGIAFELLRLYSKQQPVLVGTRSIEMSEVVSQRLQSEFLQKLLIVTRLYDAKEEGKGKKKDIDGIINMMLGEMNPSLAASVCNDAGFKSNPLDEDFEKWFMKKTGLKEECLEHFREALRHGIPHNVLNAKYHEREALIISEAGRKGAITIATNMAGRGVDILLGGRVQDEILERAREDDASEHDKLYADTYESYRRGGIERAAPPLPLDSQERSKLAEEVRATGGLFILGTERHESRRIDNQLRGRAGRQGDPGESRFFVSLEDQLWKIFNAKMLEAPTLKMWPPMEEVKAGFLTNMIRKTQERIESHFFEARKHVLEYDDVLNTQREAIYGMRREILLGRDCGPDIEKGAHEIVKDAIAANWKMDFDAGHEVFNWEGLYEDLNTVFPLVDYIPLSELETYGTGDDLRDALEDIAEQAFQAKCEELGAEGTGAVQQQCMLRAVNDRWMEHLQTVDYIREGIGLRGYGQIDPLIAYKQETYNLFKHTEKAIRDQSVRMFFRAQLQHEGISQEIEALEAEMASLPVGDDLDPTGTPGVWPEKADPKTTGRNDVCPCGSGKKFKQCHYPIFRAEGRI